MPGPLNNPRRQITDLSESIQIRELNRQLDWIWKQLLGGLSMKNVSNTGKQEAVDLIESTTADIYDPQIDDIKDELLDIEDAISDIEDDVSTAQDDIALLGSTLTGVQDDIADIQGDIDGIENDISDLQGDMMTAQDDIDALESDMTTVKNDITAIQDDISAIGDDITDLDARTDKLEQSLVYPISTQ